MNFQGRLSALNSRQYLQYWLGSLASVGATQLMLLGQGWLVFELSQSPMMLGILGAAASIPTILVTLFGGALADRMNKKKVLMLTSLLNSMLMAVIALLTYLEIVQVWQIIAIAAMVSFISGIDWPTRQAIFPLLINKESMMSAVALNSILWQSARMVLPIFGGFILAHSSPSLLFALCSAGFLMMFIVMSRISLKHSKTRHERSTLDQIKQGLAFITSEKLFYYLLLLTYSSMLFGMAFMQLLPAFAEILDVGALGYGYLMAATGVGSVSGTIATGFVQHSSRLGKVMLVSTLVSALMIFILCWVSAMAESLIGAYWLALGAIFAASFFHSIFMITSMTVLQLKVPDELRGRVMGFHGICYSLMPLGALVFGALATITSVPVAIATGVFVYLGVIFYISLTQAVVRQVSGKQELGVRS